MIVMCLFMVLVIVPVFTEVMTSFVSEAEIARRGTFIIIPEKFDFSAYKNCSPVEKYRESLWKHPVPRGDRNCAEPGLYDHTVLTDFPEKV